MNHIRNISPFVFQSPYIEKTHALISYDQKEQAFVINDLNTAHGVYVNESRVQNSAVKLANGDLVRVGFSKIFFASFFRFI